MPDTKLADLTALTTPSGDDLLYIVDNPAGTPLDRKIALDNLFTRETVTTSSPVIDASQTWNNGAATFTGLKFNATNTASGGGSSLLDLGTGGGTYVSRFNVRVDGFVYATGGIIAQGASGGGPLFISTVAGAVGYNMASGLGVGWTNSAANAVSAPDLILTRRGTANLRLGADDAATAQAQKLSVQSVVASTSNTAGADLTITGSQGTGSGVGGSIIFQTAAANSGGGATVQNTLANAMVIDSVKTVRLGTGYTVATLPAAGTAGRRTYVTDAAALTFLGALTGGGAVVCPVFDNGTAWVSA